MNLLKSLSTNLLAFLLIFLSLGNFAFADLVIDSGKLDVTNEVVTFQKQSFIKVHFTANDPTYMSYATNSWATVQWSYEENDVYDELNNYRFTAQFEGTYIIIFNTHFQRNSTHNIQIGLFKNGGIQNAHQIPGTLFSGTVFSILNLNANDIIEAKIYCYGTQAQGLNRDPSLTNMTILKLH